MFVRFCRKWPIPSDTVGMVRGTVSVVLIGG
jgi:hypothetical protein